MTEDEVLALIHGISRQTLRSWVQIGWVTPESAGDIFIYTEVDVARANLVRQLKQDCDFSDDAIATILSLTDQVHGLRRELRLLTQAVAAQPAETREAVVARMMQLRHISDRG